MNDPALTRDHVLLLNGTVPIPWSMVRLRNHLRREGFEAGIVNYPFRWPLARIVDAVTPRIVALGGVPRLHLVGFSMGGLVIRAVLHRNTPKNLGRVVMIGTPNHGSEVADRLKDWWAFRLVFGESGQQLRTDPHVTEGLFGPVDYELGVVAGDKPLDPFTAGLFNAPHDGKVAVSRTKLDGMADHLVLPHHHPGLLASRATHEQVAHFLAAGRFSRPDTAADKTASP